jgi:hypothetical protein
VKISRQAIMLASMMIVASGRAPAQQADVADQGGGLADWRVPNRCACNCLYAMFRLNRMDVKYERVYDKLPVAASGSSLKDMRRCAASLGLNTRVVKATPETLKECPLPAIAHTEEEKAVAGHYVVLISVGPQDVELIDGTTGRVLLFPKVRFCKDWTGYLLISESPRPWGSWAIAALTGAMVGVATFSRLHRRQSVIRASAPGA